ncbi:MAG: hypothetical protein R6U78_00970 [Bacteroidales bacterium]
MDGEFDIGTIIYVVITLVVLLIGLLGKKKKPATDSQADGESSTGDFMQKLERTFGFGREEEEEGDQEGEQNVMGVARAEEELGQRRGLESRAENMWEEYERIHGTREEKERIADSGFRRGEKEEETVFSDAQEPGDHLDVIELGEYEGRSYFDIVQDFDAVTAVIYSAIINRTEY